MADCGSRAKARRMKLTNDHPVSLSYGEDNAEQDYEVEEILAHDEPIPGQLMFRIKWKGYDESWNSWEPLALLDNCPDKLREYKIKSGLPLTPADATVRLSPVKVGPADAAIGSGAATAAVTALSNSYGSKKSSGKKKQTTARKTSVKRKMEVGLPPPPSPLKSSPVAKRTHISVAEVSSTSPIRTSSSGRKSGKPEILEVIDDGSGRYIVSISLPGKQTPALMWYQEMKERYPATIIDYFEKHLRFKKTGTQNFILLPAQ